MAVHKIRKGLNLPITGEPEQTIETAAQPNRVAVVAADFIGMKPTMHVQVGDVVERGQVLFDDKKTPGVRYTAPGGGRVVAVNRGDRRALQTVVIELSEPERTGRGLTTKFKSYTGTAPSGLDRDQVSRLLLESGMWTSLRARPFGRVANPEDTPKSIFVTVADSNPLAPEVATILADRESDFERGLVALSRLTDGKVFVCTGPGVQVTVPKSGEYQIEEFVGPHPSGTVGLHIHRLDPVTRGKIVWHTNYQEVIAIGRLFGSGELDVTRVISLAGPGVRRPRLLRTRLGAATDDLVKGELEEGEIRVISGSVLSGRKAQGEVHGFLGRFHHQISAIAEGRSRDFLGWLGPGFSKFSVTSVFLSKLLPGKKFAFSSSTEGSHRAIVPIGMYEKVFPLDIPAPFMMRALAVRDVERAEQLGVLELAEEDVALCSFVCPGKHEYGPLLRDVLTTIEKEG